MTRYLVIFAKPPQLGRVKSRLAAGIGAGAATAFYRRTLTRLLRRVGRDPRWRTVLALDLYRIVSVGRWAARLPRTGQGGGDLGARMGRVFRTFPPGPVCIVGADIPDVTAAHIWRAFRALNGADVVFGPARDGGYWLVGLRRGPGLPDLFDNVRWSTRHALADTRANLKGRHVALSDELDDIDDAAAYRRHKRA